MVAWSMIESSPRSIAQAGDSRKVGPPCAEETASHMRSAGFEGRQAMRLARGAGTRHSSPPMTTSEPMTGTHRRFSRFEELACATEQTIDVALGAALIARDAYDDLDVSSVLARFEELAAPLMRLGL